MSESSTCQLKTEVKAFWNRQACGTEHVRADKFSRDYFEQLEARRYQLEPFIHSFAQFTRYYGKRVLEVGFGPGTDCIQWLRAGAVVSGVDLTEEAPSASDASHPGLSFARTGELASCGRGTSAV